METLKEAKYRRKLAVRSQSAFIAIVAVIAAAMLAAGCSSDGDRNPEVALVLKTMQEGVRTAPGPVIWAGGQLFDLSLVSNPRNDEAGRFWKHFQTAYPFGLQGIALSKRREDGSCSVVVAEPPPHVTLEDLKEIIPDASILSMPIGHDGALYDVVGTLRGGNAEIDLKVRFLSLLIYRTDYKAYAYQEPFRVGWQDSAQCNLEVQPTGGELHGWVYAEDSRFVPVAGGDPLTLQQLLAERVS